MRIEDAIAEGVLLASAAVNVCFLLNSELSRSDVTLAHAVLAGMGLWLWGDFRERRLRLAKRRAELMGGK